MSTGIPLEILLLNDLLNQEVIDSDLYEMALKELKKSNLNNPPEMEDGSSLTQKHIFRKNDDNE